jgi:DNA polymerase-3 subunit epsilon
MNRFEQAAALLREHPDYRVLTRVRLDEGHVFGENDSGEPCGRLAIIDTETTGLEVANGDRIIDIAIAVCEYGRHSGRPLRIVARYEGLEDPGVPIPPVISALTGITDEMVQGQSLDDAALADAMSGVTLAVCHNARFDRAFLESRFPLFAQVSFACSLDEIPWKDWQIASTKLDYLGYRFGLFHEGHRARADVDMLLALLAQPAPGDTRTLLSILLNHARQPTWRVHAVNLPFECKDAAKANGYAWNEGKYDTIKAWWKETRDEAAERAFLESLGCRKPVVVKETALERYRSLRG